MSELDFLATRLQALADPVRLALLRLITAAPRTATECIAATGLTQPRVARHLRILVDQGFLRSRRQGRFVVYTPAVEVATAGVVRAVLTLLAEAPSGAAPLSAAPATSRSAPPQRQPAPRVQEPEPAGREPDEAPARPMEDFLL